VEEAVSKLEENWITAGYSSPEEAAEALADGRELITQYVEEVVARPPTARTVCVEKQFREDMGSFVLIGRVDRIDEHEDGTLEIIDYKSGRSETTVEALRDDLAMNCYQLLVRSKMKADRVLSTIVALRTNHVLSYEPEREELDQFKTDLLELGIEIINRDFDELRPSAKAICPECDFLQLCLRDEEFSERVSELETVE
jgi:RecB family exonuclease